jgi:tagaturonate reductase
MQVIISNTTEVGISLIEADANAENPVSFPGRLLAFLLARFNHFNGSGDSGMVIVPTELITNNGAKLKAIVTELARLGSLSEEFIHWLQNANDFCNSLVDRIVPGKPGKTVMGDMQEALGYTDDLMIMSETYRLWAIETKNERTKNILSFASADKGVILAPDIEKFRELKLRLLNGTHTFTCGLARLAGFTFVKDALENEIFTALLSSLMLGEIVPVVAGGNITREESRAFAEQVIDRFRNPYINHQWQHITVQYTAKMAMRNIPLIRAHFATNKKERFSLMAVGFAGYLLYMKPGTGSGETLVNKMGDQVTDEQAAQIFAYWKQYPNPEQLVAAVLSDKNLWGADMCKYQDFEQQVVQAILAIQQVPVMEFIRSVFAEKTIA